jgi:hypothetical protein
MSITANWITDQQGTKCNCWLLAVEHSVVVYKQTHLLMVEHSAVVLNTHVCWWWNIQWLCSTYTCLLMVEHWAVVYKQAHVCWWWNIQRLCTNRHTSADGGTFCGCVKHTHVCWWWNILWLCTNTHVCWWWWNIQQLYTNRHMSSRPTFFSTHYHLSPGKLRDKRVDTCNRKISYQPDRFSKFLSLHSLADFRKTTKAYLWTY